MKTSILPLIGCKFKFSHPTYNVIFYKEKKCSKIVRTLNTESLTLSYSKRTSQ